MHRYVQPVFRRCGWRSLLREVGLLGVLYAGYTVARLFADDSLALARRHARDVLDLEAAVGLDVERAMNGALVSMPLVEVAAAYCYASLHYLVTPVVLVVLWRRVPGQYARWRWVLVIATVVALACYLAYPTAPPRLETGYVDTLAGTSHWGWWGADASAPRGLGTTTNELAAMPSMHVGWALWCAWAMSGVVRSPRVRALVWAYPALTTLVIVATANHWVLDAVAGAALVLLAGWVVRPWRTTGASRVGSQPTIKRRRIEVPGAPPTPARPVEERPDQEPGRDHARLERDRRPLRGR